MQIAKITDAGTTFTPEYSGDGKILAIREESGGIKPMNLLHTFEISTDKWTHKVTGDRVREVVYHLEGNKIAKREGREITKYTYSNDFLVQLDYENHEYGMIKEILTWNNGILVRTELYRPNGLAETREIVSHEDKNVFAGVPREIMMVLYGPLGFLYFFAHHNFKTFEKIRIDEGSKRVPFAFYDIKYTINTSGFRMGRKGSKGAKDVADVEVFYKPA